MKSSLLLTTIIAFCGYSLNAQTASDALEKGERIRKGENLYLYYDHENSILKQDVTKLVNIVNSNTAATVLPDFTTLGDSSLFLVSASFNIRMVPLNPLNYSHSSEVTFVPDPIDATFSEAISSIIGTASAHIPALDNTNSLARTFRGQIGNSNNSNAQVCDLVEYLIKQTDTLSTALKSDNKETINKIFLELKDIDFKGFQSAGEKLKLISTKMAPIEKYYKDLAAKLKVFADSVPKIECGSTEIEKFIIKKTFKDVHEELNGIYTSQVKRFGNLKNAFKLVNNTYTKAKDNSGYLDIQEVNIPKGKIKYVSVTINEAGYKLSDEKEIIKVESKAKTKRNLVFQRFRRFVPEVAAGTAYADLDFPQFIGSTDSLGVTRVEKGASEVFNRLTFDVMINFNYYIPNSDLHPFFQLGVGANSDFPTLFTGVGFRISDGALKRISLSAGFAGTWIQTLQDLEVGEIINEAKDVEDDITYDFCWGRPYFGIQYNF